MRHSSKPRAAKGGFPYPGHRTVAAIWQGMDDARLTELLQESLHRRLTVEEQVEGDQLFRGWQARTHFAAEAGR